MTEPPEIVITAVMGAPVSEYCAACRAYTVTCAPLYLLSPAGVTLFRHIALCSVCDDPDDDEPRRRIPRR